MRVRNNNVRLAQPVSAEKDRCSLSGHDKLGCRDKSTNGKYK